MLRGHPLGGSLMEAWVSLRPPGPDRPAWLGSHEAVQDQHAFRFDLLKEHFREQIRLHDA
eukprot:scaffold1639_cov331-Pavlova_lutheri.AAC.24